MKTAVMFNVVLGQVVVAARKGRNLTQGEAAHAAGLLQSGLSRLERGETTFTIGQLRRVAGALGTHASDIVLAAEDGERALAKQGIQVLEETPPDKESSKVLWLEPAQVEQVLVAVGARKRTARDFLPARLKEKEEVLRAGTRRR